MSGIKTLIIDNHDSYTYNLFQLIAEVNGDEPVVIVNDAPHCTELDLGAFDNIVVSPGPGHPARPRDFGAGGRTVLRVPFTGGFQIDLQCRTDDDPDAFGTAEAARRWLPGVIGGDHTERILWVSTYRFMRVVATRFTDRHRRVLLTGEAAHLFPPFGARGMNSGIADAAAAASAIAEAMADPERTERRSMERFATARRSAALYNSAAAGQALEHLRPRRRMVRAEQRAAAALSPVLPRCGAWLDNAPYGPPANPDGKY